MILAGFWLTRSPLYVPDPHGFNLLQVCPALGGHNTHPPRSGAPAHHHVSPRVWRRSSQRLMWGNCSIWRHFLLLPFRFPPLPAGHTKSVPRVMKQGRLVVASPCQEPRQETPSVHLHVQARAMKTRPKWYRRFPAGGTKALESLTVKGSGWTKPLWLLNKVPT